MKQSNFRNGRYSLLPKFTSLFLILVLASVALLRLTIGEFTMVYVLSTVNIWFAVVGGYSHYIGSAYYMLKNVSACYVRQKQT
jgi:NADH-quinone oxidoreductase subunit M